MAGKLPFAPQRRHLNQASAPPARRGDHGIVLITPSTPLIAPTIADIRAAAERIAPHAVVTPLLSSPALDAAAGGRVLLKAEVLQHTGSFKLQGALNRLLQLTPDERINGVVAYSSGNHAQAIADNATLLGLPWVVVMPKDAPPLKIERTRAVGADVVLSDRYTEDRVAIGGAIAKERGAMIVPPFQSPHIVAGQGTLALEALTQAAAMGAEVDALLVCCVGGGLTAGCALAAEAVSPRTRVHPCKPSVFDDTARSLELGHCGANAPGVRSICDSIVTETPGEFTFSSNLPRVGSPPSIRAPARSGASRAPADAPTVRCARPRRPATTRGRSVGASVQRGRPIGPRGDPAPTENAVQTNTEARRRAEIRPPRARRPSRGQRSRRTFAGYSTDPD